ncbi:MAG: M48 family metallopeptidase, partial [Planctomycetes bacterium]|nr:M48 family metallopeptidase [Planctomycetota bacterium]
MKFVPRRLEKSADASRGQPRWKDWIKGLTSIVIIGYVTYLLLGFAADSLADGISEETEAKWFQWVELGDNPRQQPKFSQAERIFDRLCSDSELRPLPYELVYINEKAPNAFALPGGLVGVTKGLLEMIDTEIGLAFVLAHELGHHQNRHALKRLGRTLLTGAAFHLVAGASAGDLAIIDSGLTLAGLAYTRDQELDADLFGLNLVHRAYGTTVGALEFFETMLEISGNESSFAAMLHSHPLTEDRMENI